MSMPAGRYYVGDLCYVMNEEWHEACGIVIKDECVANGEFVLSDGRRFALYGTLYGDGIYSSNIGTQHSVDSGCIGCMKVVDIRGPINSMLGAVIDFEEMFHTGCDEYGTIHFGHIQIQTGD